MSNSSPGLEKGEFYIFIPELVVCAPIRLTDDQGEELFNQIKPQLVEHLNEMKMLIENNWPEVRVGFDIS